MTVTEQIKHLVEYKKEENLKLKEEVKKLEEIFLSDVEELLKVEGFFAEIRGSQVTVRYINIPVLRGSIGIKAGEKPEILFLTCAGDFECGHLFTDWKTKVDMIRNKMAHIIAHNIFAWGLNIKYDK